MGEGSVAGVLLVVFGKAPVDVGQGGTDAVLVTLGWAGRWRRRSARRGVVAFGFQTCPVGGEVGDLLAATGGAPVEGGVGSAAGIAVGGLVDGDGFVGVFDEPFCQVEGRGAAGATCLLGGAAGAGEIGIGDAVGACGEVKQHPRPAHPVVALEWAVAVLAAAARGEGRCRYSRIR